jgi:hypothetical protein
MSPPIPTAMTSSELYNNAIHVKVDLLKNLAASHETRNPYDSSTPTIQSTDPAILASLMPTAPTTSIETPGSHVEIQQPGEREKESSHDLDSAAQDPGSPIMCSCYDPYESAWLEPLKGINDSLESVSNVATAGSGLKKGVDGEMNRECVKHELTKVGEESHGMWPAGKYRCRKCSTVVTA